MSSINGTTTTQTDTSTGTTTTATAASEEDMSTFEEAMAEEEDTNTNLTPEALDKALRESMVLTYVSKTYDPMGDIRDAAIDEQSEI